MSKQLALYTTDEQVGIVTINRPDKLNAIDAELKKELYETLMKADADSATSVVLLRASGRSFCVGYDMARKDPSAAKRSPLMWHDHLSEAIRLELMPWDMRKPVVAAVQGHALGGGCELAMMCDITVASDDALFGEPEIRFSTAGPAIVMPWFIGLKKARELLYLGDMIDAATALNLGMVNRVVPKSELEETSLKFAKRLTLISPEALRVTKLAISRGAEAAGFRNAVNVGLDVVSPLYATRTELGDRFKNLTEKEGLGAALKWRGEQFKV